VAPLAIEQIGPLLKGLDGWALGDHKTHKTYQFQGFHETLAFVNAVAWISHRENHHPDLVVGYNTCCVKYWTHAIAGLSENDFICAAKVDALFEL
jgi:4a-hydroxytetrahydrobiopterin dehydratase